ncbi:MAG: hypothetical protein JWO67_147 [Streptosporangiaceae bacterium]|nr:hypothetical protein [Streptosporangiaceae bacterium]
MADSQPPEGLRKLFIEVAHGQNCIGCVTGRSACGGLDEVDEDVADAFLAALFEACEVREAYCTRYSDHVGSVDYPAETAEQALAAAGRASDDVDAVAMRWLVIETDREPVSSTGEEKTDGA